MEGSLSGHGQCHHRYGGMRCPLSPRWVSIGPKEGLRVFGVTRHPRHLPSCKSHSCRMTSLVLLHSEIPLIPPTAPQQTNLQGGKVSCSHPEAFRPVCNYQANRKKSCAWADKGSREGDMSHCAWCDPTTCALPQEAVGAKVPDEPLNHLRDLWARHLSSSSSTSQCPAAKSKNFPRKSTSSSPAAKFSGGEKVNGWVKTNAGEAS